jgi:hypothetical protein
MPSPYILSRRSKRVVSSVRGGFSRGLFSTSSESRSTSASAPDESETILAGFSLLMIVGGSYHQPELRGITNLLWISRQNQFIRFQDRHPANRFDRLSSFIDYTNIKIDIIQLFRSSRMAGRQDHLLISIHHCFGIREMLYLSSFHHIPDDFPFSLTMFFP